MNNPRLKLIAASIALALSSAAAHAVLERVGPINTASSVGSFPAWYQDTTGIALEFCDPKNLAEVSGGHCLLLPADVPLVPEVFPINFFDEHFYFAAGASLTTTGGGSALLTLAQEAVAPNVPAPGGQHAFSRIRVKLTVVPVSGTYRFIHPYGEEVLDGVAGGRIFFTDDVGINCAPGQFDCALTSRLGPFLLPAATPGGLELPPVAGPATGKLYIADPNRVGPVTGSALPDFTDSGGQLRNHNIFRIEGPAGSNLGGPGIDFVETTAFSLMGRLYTGAMPGRVDVERASYTRNASGNKVDVFASAYPTTRGRLPAQPAPAAVAPSLSFFATPCAGTVDADGVVHPPYSAPLDAVASPMLADGGTHWGQTQAAVIPATVCVQDLSATDALGNVVPLFTPHGVSDEVTITQAAYDPATQSLTIAASSSDQTVPPTLAATFGTFRGDLVNGQLVIPALAVPPANVRVQSSAHGVTQLAVSTGFVPAPVPPTDPVPPPTDPVPPPTDPVPPPTDPVPPPTDPVPPPTDPVPPPTDPVPPPTDPVPPPPPPVIPPPVATNDAFSVPEDGGPHSLAVLSNDSNAVGGIVSLVTAPQLGSAAVNADGTLTYTPRLNANGSDSLSYTVTVGAGVSNVASVAISVTPVNDAPTAVNDTAATTVNVPVAINVLANDADPEGAADLVAAVIVTQPAAGASAGAVGGVVNFNATTPGSYSFTYAAQDAAQATSAPATVTVQVTDIVNIGRAEYVSSSSNLRVQGTVSPGVAEIITLSFVNAAGTTLGAAGAVSSVNTGKWELNRAVALPTGATAVKAVSARGGTRTIGISFK